MCLTGLTREFNSPKGPLPTVSPPFMSVYNKPLSQGRGFTLYFCNMNVCYWNRKHSAYLRYRFQEVYRYAIFWERLNFFILTFTSKDKTRMIFQHIGSASKASTWCNWCISQNEKEKWNLFGFIWKTFPHFLRKSRSILC